MPSNVNALSPDLGSRVPMYSYVMNSTSAQVRCTEAPADNRIYPNDAQLATLPHYVDPTVRTGRSEVQESFGNPYKAAEFYYREPNLPGSKPQAVHLQKTFIN